MFSILTTKCISHSNVLFDHKVFTAYFHEYDYYRVKFFLTVVKNFKQAHGLGLSVSLIMQNRLCMK